MDSSAIGQVRLQISVEREESRNKAIDLTEIYPLFWRQNGVNIDISS